MIGRDPLPPRAVSAMSLQQQIKEPPPPPTITVTSEDKTPDHTTTNSLGRKVSPSSTVPGGGGGGSGGGGGGGGGSGGGSTPHNSGSLERGDPAEGQGKRVSIYLSCFFFLKNANNGCRIHYADNSKSCVFMLRVW